MSDTIIKEERIKKSKKMMALVTAQRWHFGSAGCGGGEIPQLQSSTLLARQKKKHTAAEAVTEATEAAMSEGSDN